MTAVRIIESAVLLLFGTSHLMASFNAAGKNIKTVWAGGILGLLEFALAYVIWL